jgi:glucan phosphoethanolaminetransferase (alkaline phosphatase superfamily)
MGRRLRQMRREILGERPSAVLLFVTPTFLAILLDFALRAPSLLVFPPKEWLNYFGSSLASAGFWGGPLWLTSRLFAARGWPARVGLGLFYGLFVLPLATFSFGGQLLYYRVFHSYMARDTVRLGIKLRGTLGAWLSSWGASVFLMFGIGLLVTAILFLAARRASKPARPASRTLPVVGFAVAASCFWVDFVESRSLQAAPPDTCFIHGVMHALRDAVTGKGWVRRGISLREPEPLPPLPVPEHRPSILLVITESVRADAICSARTPTCTSQFLDGVAPDRLPLGKLTTQSSGTFSACVMLWTGLAPDADFTTMHHAAVLWEIAKSLGYRTAYIGSQNLRYDDFGDFLKHAGIDVEASAADLGNATDAHLGAPDENATARMLEFVRDVPAGTPYFAVLHLSNTHWPYRVDPDLQPFAPHDPSPVGDVRAMHNHYRNSVLQQERTVSSFFGSLEALPSWGDTAVLFLSDHGEQFREHGGLYHLSSLFDEQVRVPGFLLAGDQAVSAEQKDALAAWVGRRTYTQDVHATMLDLLGVLDARPSLPFSDRLTGRSLLRPPGRDEPMVLLSTASGVWEPDDAKYGVMRGDMLAVKSESGGWWCFDTRVDPVEVMGKTSMPGCGPLIDLGNARFGPVWAHH